MTAHPRRSTRLLPSPPPDTIRAARSAAGHTQRQAADTLGLSYRAWEMWEAGERPMPADRYQLYLLLTGQTTIEVARAALAPMADPPVRGNELTAQSTSPPCTATSGTACTGRPTR